MGEGEGLDLATLPFVKLRLPVDFCSADELSILCWHPVEVVDSQCATGLSHARFLFSYIAVVCCATSDLGFAMCSPST